jgi:hypothetical protein
MLTTLPDFCFSHLPDCELSDIQKAQKIDRDEGMEVFLGKIRKVLREEDAGVVHQHIDGSEVRNCRIHCRDRGLSLADIAIDQNKFGCGAQRMTHLSRCCDNIVAGL